MTVPLVDRAAAVRGALRMLVARDGFHGASMSAVASEAGVATGTAYTHYASKDELVLAAYREAKAQLAVGCGGRRAVSQRLAGRLPSPEGEPRSRPLPAAGRPLALSQRRTPGGDRRWRPGSGARRYARDRRPAAATAPGSDL